MANRTCSVDGCDSPHVARGFCNRHYLRWSTYGDPTHARALQRDKKCAIPGCTSPRRGREWCNMHYLRWRNHGDPLAIKKAAPLSGRFWRRVDPQPSGCWHWLGYVDVHGYGMVSTQGGSLSGAHRVAWELLVAPIPPGLHIDHRRTCEKRCVNPAHLRVVTPKQNIENRSGLRKDNKSGHTGVWWSKQSKRWVARVRHNKEEHYLGMFDDVETAARAAERKRLELFTHNDIDRS